ncbi:MAG: PD-(D/E)XK nuclease family protein, partial [Bilifractor sp.]
ELYYGLQLQLAVYLNAALEADQKKHPGKKTEPAGVFYYHIDDPMIDAEKAGTEEERLKALLKQLMPQGLCRSEMDILKHLDRTLGPGVTSDVIPAGLTKSGVLTKASQTESLEHFAQIRNFADRKVKELGNRIVQGEIRADPFIEEGRSACTYCPYGGICGYDRRIPGYAFRRLRNLGAEEAMDLIREMENGDNGNGSEMDS